MPRLVPYVPDQRRYEDVFGNHQSGASGTMVRYRGNPYQNGSGFFPQVLKNLFSKLGTFVRPLLAKAAPHARAALSAAQPHLQEAATGVIKDVTNQAKEAIARKLTPQEGTGRKRKASSKGPKSKRTKRIPPYHLADIF